MTPAADTLERAPYLKGIATRAQHEVEERYLDWIVEQLEYPYKTPLPPHDVMFPRFVAEVLAKTDPDIIEPYWGGGTDADVSYFVSGATDRADFTACARAGQYPGLVAQRITNTTLDLISTLPLRWKLFLDTGAFSEADIEDGRPPRWPRPISDREWRRRLRVMGRLAQIADNCGHEAYLCAPDMVANQAGSLRRLARYIDIVRSWEAHVIVPLHKGALSLPRCWERVQRLSVDADHREIDELEDDDIAPEETLAHFRRSAPPPATT